MQPPLVEVVNAVCCVAILVLGAAYYVRTRHLDLSRRAADRRARLYVLLMVGVAVLGLGMRLGLGVRLAFDVAMFLQR